MKNTHFSEVYYKNGKLKHRGCPRSWTGYYKNGRVKVKFNQNNYWYYYASGVMSSWEGPGFRIDYYRSGKQSSLSFNRVILCYYESGSVKSFTDTIGRTEEYDDIWSVVTRCQTIKKELVAKVFHPSRVSKWFEEGGHKLIDMMFGVEE